MTPDEELPPVDCLHLLPWRRNPSEGGSEHWLDAERFEMVEPTRISKENFWKIKKKKMKIRSDMTLSFHVSVLKLALKYESLDYVLLSVGLQ